MGFKDTERLSIVEKINDACREIWDSTDLMESTDEKIFDINVDSQTVTLPHFCENIRKMRYFDGRQTINIDDQRNRYNDSPSNELWPFKCRLKKRSPLVRDIDNFTRLKFTLALAESSDFTISISGQTTNSSKSNEVINVPAGTLTFESAFDYVNVTNIVKSRVTTYDILVSDGNDTQLSFIPNNLLLCKYIVIQLIDQVDTTNYASFSSVEAHYKLKYEPMYNDYDEFAFGDKYDMAVVWKFLEQNKNSYIEAAAAQVKCSQVINQIRENEEVGIKRKINFSKQPLFNLPYNTYGLRRS